MTKYEEYDSPTDVLTDRNISKNTKIEILEQWCEDEEALLRASGEGMNNGERPQLRQVQQALETLNYQNSETVTDNSQLKQSLENAEFETATKQVKAALGTDAPIRK